jgi:pimeloyl-ACP methyl ester carboxylesterase
MYVIYMLFVWNQAVGPEGTIMGTSGDGFARRRVELGAGPINYREIGEGRPIVFVHGFGVDGRLWDGTVAGLAEGHRCIVPDWPLGAHREAMSPSADMTVPGVARLIGEFLAALDLDDVVLVGNDSGGTLCQIHVTTDAPRVGALVLTNTDCFENFPPGHFKLMARLIRLPGVPALFAHSMRLRANRRSPLAYGALTAEPIDDALLRDWSAPQVADRGVRRDAARFFGSADPALTLAAAERFGELRIPTLIAWGTDDRFFPVEYGRRLADAIPGARLVEIEGAKTFVPMDRPEELARAIASFVAAPLATAER